MWRTLIAAALTCACTAAAAQTVTVTWLTRVVPPPPTLSNLEPRPEDLGRAGARLGLTDNATTGRFMGQEWQLEIREVAPDGDFAAAAAEALAQSPFLVLDAPAADLLAAADLPEAAQALLFNAGAEDVALRSEECRANLLHTAVSRRMKSDALLQFAVSRRWSSLALIEGPLPGDAAFAEALTASAAKFGQKIAARKSWAYDADMRRNAAQELPLFTQGLGEYDLLLVADEANDFARYIPFNTWLPRPVAGAEGLSPVTWAPVLEQWGAAQLQSRFRAAANRPMQDRDYATWAALRALGEAVTRTKSADPRTLRSYLLGPGFELAGFKGRPLTFRDWNGQLRQPIPLVTRGALVASAPLEGFLHQHNELDSLGLDRPDSRCTAFTP